MGCVILSSIGQAFTGPSFFVWMSGLVPGRVGPTFWARRYQIGTLAGIGAVLLGGWLGDSAGWVKAIIPTQWRPAALNVLQPDFDGGGGLRRGRHRRVFRRQRGARNARQTEEVAAVVGLDCRAVARTDGALLSGVRRGFDVGFSPRPARFCGCFAWKLWSFPKRKPAFCSRFARFWAWRFRRNGGAKSPKLTARARCNASLRVGLILIPVAWVFAQPNWGDFAGSGFIFIGRFGGGVRDFQSQLHHARRAAFAAPDAHGAFSICAGTTFALTAWANRCTLAGATKGVHLDVAGVPFVNYQLIFALSILPRAFQRVRAGAASARAVVVADARDGQSGGRHIGGRVRRTVQSVLAGASGLGMSCKFRMASRASDNAAPARKIAQPIEWK